VENNLTKKICEGAVENHLTKKIGEGAVENHLTKTRGRCSGRRCIGEPSHQKNQGKVQWRLRTTSPKN
jgi:hypothetical protein